MASYKNLFLLHFIVLIFGFTGILGKLISIDAEPLVFWRCLIGSIALGVFMALRGKVRRLPWKTVARLAGIGAIAATHWITFFGAIKVSNVSVALATLASSALFVSLFAPLVTPKRFDWRESVLGLMVIIGITIILKVETQYTLGIILALISAFLAGVFSTFNSLEVQKHDALNISLYELGSAAVLVLLYLAVRGEVSMALVTMPATDWLWLILLATVATAFAYVVSVSVMRELSPFTVALAINMEPIYSIILALWIFGEEEKMSPGFYQGAALILLALVIDAMRQRSARRNQRQSSVQAN
jgi:drug/metabolite transporter (DMT)-like permease